MQQNRDILVCATSGYLKLETSNLKDTRIILIGLIITDFFDSAQRRRDTEGHRVFLGLNVIAGLTRNPSVKPVRGMLK